MKFLQFTKFSDIWDGIQKWYDVVLIWLKENKWLYSGTTLAIILTFIGAVYTYKSYMLSKNQTTPIEDRQSALLATLLEKLYDKDSRFRIEMYKDESRINSGVLVPLNHITKMDLNYYKENSIFSNYKPIFSKETLNAPVFFIFGEREEVMSEILKIADNPFLPSDVKEKMNFLRTEGGSRKTSYDKLPYRNVIYFSKNGQELAKDKSNWTYESNNECTLKEYLEKYKSLFNEIDIWIEKTTRTKGRLDL